MIDLSELEGEARSFADELLLRPEELHLDEVVGPLEVRLQGTVRPVPPDFHVQGTIQAHGRLQCSRCLEPVDWSLDEEYSFFLSVGAPPEAGDEVALDEADLDVVFLEDNSFDLKQLATEQVDLGVPMRIVCSENCAGLCPHCGGNRNLEDGCQCEPEVDPRWESLKGLKGS